MSADLSFQDDIKAGTVRIRGRGIDATYPANGYLTATASTTVNDTIDIALPGGTLLFKSQPRLNCKDLDTGLKLGADVSAAVTNLTNNYFDLDTGITLLDLADYNGTGSPTANHVLKWDGTGFDFAAESGGSSGAEESNDLTDVDTTGIASGDGLRHNGTGFVAGKWGVGTEDQVIPANADSAGATRRTITLSTDTVFPTQITSTNSLDLVDSNGNKMESVQMLEVDVGAGPTLTATQEKFGVLLVKEDAYGTTARVGFNNQYSAGGNSMYLQCDPVTAPWTLNLPADKSTTTGQVLSVASSSTSLQTDLEWTTPSSGGGGGNTIYNFDQTCYNSVTTSTDNYYWLPGSVTYGFEFYDNNEMSTLSTSATWNRYKKMSHRLPSGTYDLAFYVDIAMSASSAGTTHASDYSEEDIEVQFYKVARSGNNGNVTLTQIGTTQYNTQDQSDTAVGSVTNYDVTGQTFNGEERIMIVLKGTISQSATRYAHWAYDFTAEKTA